MDAPSVLLLNNNYFQPYEEDWWLEEGWGVFPAEERVVKAGTWMSMMTLSPYRLQLRDDGVPWWLSDAESTCQLRRHAFDPWSGKIPPASEQLSLWATTIETVL